MKPLLSDGRLQAFSRFTDTQAMRDIWRERLSFEFNACSVQYARCRTYLNPQSWHKSFLCVCYQFDGVAQSDTMHKPVLYGRAYLHGRSQEEFAALNQSSSARHLADLDMIVWPFPSDPELPQLPELLRQGRADFNHPAFRSCQYFRALHCRSLLLHSHSIIPALMDARIDRAQQLGTSVAGRARDGEYRALPAERARQFRDVARAILRRQQIKLIQHEPTFLGRQRFAVFF